jgi:2-polyprenyl-6-methoxyphenol hydroxylase-like FAD-dependent oxidoreductase
MARRVGEHAIVVGASMSGLLAARALADHYERVTVIERDELRSDEPRRGVPQSRHIHGLLARGGAALEAFFPGFGDELVARGAIRADLLADSLMCVNGGYLARASSGLTGLASTRPMLEGCVRRRLLQLSNVGLIDSCAVLQPESETHGGWVTGVRVVRKPDRGERTTMSADLVVDATGRGSRSPAWLGALGFDPPEREEIEVNITYTTRLYRRRADQLGGVAAVIVAPGEPLWRGGGALAQEGDRWIVSLAGYHGDHAPPDDRGFAEFARSLPVGELHELASSAEPVSEFMSFRFPANVRRHYERLTRFPEGFLVIGDALCSFNPIYGQGMTVAALEASALRDCLARGPQRLAQRFFEAAARITDVPWQMAVGQDLCHPRTRGRRTRAARALDWYVRSLQLAARRDAALGRAFIAVANLVAPPPTLVRPATLLRVLRGSLPGRTAPAAGSAGSR